MLGLGLAFAAGAFLGWTVPQPQWAKTFKDWVVSLFKGAAAPPSDPATKA